MNVTRKIRTISFPQEIDSWIDKGAKEELRSFSYQLEKIVREYMKLQEKKPLKK